MHSFHLKKITPVYFFIVMAAIAGLPANQTAAQIAAPVRKAAADPYHTAYENSTLTRSELPVLMPYNRVLHPAGTVLRYGDPNLENHSLDLKRIPGTTLLAVEDRYGIAVVDYQQRKIKAIWTFTGSAYKGFMSTYSGIEVLQQGKNTRIFWSAAQSGDQRQSAVFEAVWNGSSLKIADTIGFASAAPAR